MAYLYRTNHIYIHMVDYGRLQFRFSQVISDLPAHKDWLQLMIDFSTKVAKLFANQIGRFLIFITGPQPGRGGGGGGGGGVRRVCPHEPWK